MSNQIDLGTLPALGGVPAAPPRLLLHPMPSFLEERPQAVELVDLTIEPIGLRLTSDRDLATRRPFPNKRWAIACRRRGRSATTGVLIDIDWPHGDLVATARWSVDTKRIVERSVRYRLLNCEFEEVRSMPTIERGRFTSPLAGNRMPSIEDAFRT